MIPNRDYKVPLGTLKDAVDKARARFGLDVSFSIAVSRDVAEAFEAMCEGHIVPSAYGFQRTLMIDGVKIWRLDGAEPKTCLVCVAPDALCGRPILVGEVT